MSNAARPKRAPRIETCLTHLPGGIEHVTGTCRQYDFPLHVHDGYTIGMVTAGRETILSRGSSEVAGPGSVYFYRPDEAHAGRALDGSSWRYASLYVPETLVQTLTGLCGGDTFAFPERSGGARNPSALISVLFADLADAANGNEIEMCLSEFFGRLIVRAEADASVVDRLDQVRARLRADPVGAPGLTDLARSVELTPAYLVAAFRARFGITPHAYRLAHQVHRARKAVQAGAPPAEIADMTGFFDQSHLSRHFRRITGLTPGQYARSAGNGRT